MLKTNIIYKGDCLDRMEEIQDESIDLIVTDPPYGLSDSKSDESIIKKAIGTFSNLVFPNFDEAQIQVTQYSDLVSILAQGFDLRRFEARSVRVKPRIGMPKKYH